MNCTAEYLKLPAGLKNLKVFVVSKGIERLDIQGIEIEELRFSGTGLENTIFLKVKSVWITFRDISRN